MSIDNNITQHYNITASSYVCCPDLMTLNDIGEADNLRGRIVRVFFWVLDRVWKV